MGIDLVLERQKDRLLRGGFFLDLLVQKGAYLSQKVGDALGQHGNFIPAS